jgi:hydrogenase nickel incorporation protein HypB
MCRDCGCGDPEIVPIEVQTKILAGNDRVAAHNREHFEQSGILTINLMGSPGAGKTAVLERTASLLGSARVGAITADLATDNDAERLERAGIPSKSITTGTACHLDARLVHNALHDAPWSNELTYLFIENVGNLVCPAVYDLGEAFNVVALSVTEGEDKPLKYPTMFLKADLVLITKTDLVPHLDIQLDKIHESLSRVMPNPLAFEVSAKNGAGLDRWMEWLQSKRAALGAALSHHDHDHEHEHGHDHHHDHTTVER